MTTAQFIRPADAGELRQVVAEAAAHGQILEARGRGGKRDVGVPRRTAAIVDLGAFTGVVDYEPSELVLTVKPATPLTDIEALLAANGQMLAFEPWDQGVLFGRTERDATIGGVVASAAAGPRRVSAGSARDHLLGFAAVSGRGEIFKGGGKVVKNVTGYDISKVMAGSWGQLAIMTELTLKVMPRPRAETTLVLRGLGPTAAVQAMARAMGSRCAVAAAAHVPGGASSASLTVLKIEGFHESVALRSQQLRVALAEFGNGTLVDGDESLELWRSVREVYVLRDAEVLWRVQLPPSHAASFAAVIESAGASWFCDWAGALVWVGAPASVDVRAAAEGCAGQAMLMRAPPVVRQAVPIRHPETPGVAALSGRLKHAFDPAGVLDPHRFT